MFFRSAVAPSVAFMMLPLLFAVCHASAATQAAGGESAYAVEPQGAGARTLMRHQRRNAAGRTGRFASLAQKEALRQASTRSAAARNENGAGFDEYFEPTWSFPAMLASHDDRRRCAGLDQTGRRLLVEDCSTVKGQEWYFKEGQLRLKSGGCLYHALKSDDVAVGPCRRGDNAKWYLDSARRLRSRHKDSCLDRGGLNGDELFVSACSSAGSQVWLFQTQASLLKALMATSQHAVPASEAELTGLGSNRLVRSPSSSSDSAQDAALAEIDSSSGGLDNAASDTNSEHRNEERRLETQVAKRLADIRLEFSTRLTSLQHDIDAELKSVGNSVAGASVDGAEASLLAVGAPSTVQRDVEHMSEPLEDVRGPSEDDSEQP